MLVAEVLLTSGRHSFGGGTVHRVGFEDVEIARAEFERISDLIRNYAKRNNDLPGTVRCEGPSASVELPLSDVGSVALCDFAKANEVQIGMADSFPLLFKR